MKKFKLILATVLVFVMTFALAACSAPVVGTWELVEGKAEGVSVDVEDLGMSLTIEVNADGTLVMTTEAEGESMEEEGYWTFEDDTLSIYEDEDKEGTAVEIAYEDGKLVLEMMGMELIFEKK